MRFFKKKSPKNNTPKNKISTKSRLTNARKKQLAVGGIVLGILLIIVLIGAQYIEAGKTKRAAEASNTQVQRIQTTDFAQAPNFVSPEALWNNTEGAKVNELDRRMEQMEAMFKQNQTSSPAFSNNDNGPDGLGVPSEVDMTSLPPRPPASTLPNPGAVPSVPDRKIKSLDIRTSAPSGTEMLPNNGGSRVVVSPNARDNAEWAQVNRPAMNIEVVSGGGRTTHQEQPAKFRALDSYIPSGTFFRSVLLGGVDAPTGGDAQNANPHPVLLRVSDLAQLPNRFKYNFRECFVTGTAYGDLSSERAYVRTEKLSCVGTDGRAIDMKIKGYIAGEDGKTGIRGAVISKQGQMLANALLAGVISGLGNGFSNSMKITNDTAFGSSTSVPGSDQYKAGLGEGLGSAADRLAQYYIKLADKVFPVIEVNAGRIVDVVLLEGISIDTSN